MPRQLAPVPGDKGSGFVKSKSVLIALAEGVVPPLLATLPRQDSWCALAATRIVRQVVACGAGRIMCDSCESYSLTGPSRFCDDCVRALLSTLKKQFVAVLTAVCQPGAQRGMLSALGHDHLQAQIPCTR